MKKLMLLILIWLSLIPAWSQTFKNKKLVVAAGGRTAGSSLFNTSATVGQSSIGVLSSATFKILAGYQNTLVTVVVPNNVPTDINISSNSFNENQPDSSVVCQLFTTDIDMFDIHTYTLAAGTGGEENASFFIAGDKLKSKYLFDFEAKNIYRVRIKTDDGNGGTFIKNFVLNINDMNDPPTNLSLNDTTIREDLPSGTKIGDFTAQDQDVDETFTYTLVPGTGSDDNGSFSIASGALYSAEVFHNYLKSKYHIKVKVEDSGGDSLFRAFNINVEWINNIPVSLSLTDSLIMENAGAGEWVGILSASDADVEDTLNYALVAGSGDQDNSNFMIRNDSLLALTSFNYESVQQYQIRCEANDNKGGVISRSFGIVVQDANDPPSGITLSDTVIFEDQPVNTVIGSFTAQDEDPADTHTFTLVSGSGGEDNASFIISGNDLHSGEVFKEYLKSLYHILVKAEDPMGLSVTKPFIIGVTAVNYPPNSLQLSDSVIAENQVSGTVTGNLSASDPDPEDTVSYTLSAGAGDSDNALFTINGDQLLAASAFNYEVKNQLSLRIAASDEKPGGTIEKVFNIYVTDVNEAPTDLTLSVDSVSENLPANTLVGNLNTLDQDSGEHFLYSFITGTNDNDQFTLEGNALKTAVTFNYELKNIYTVEVHTLDKGSLPIDKTLTVRIYDANDAPTDVSLDHTDIYENNPANTVIGDLTTSDEDLSDHHSYSLISGTGGEDNTSFNITGAKLESGETFNYELKNTYHVLIKTDDGRGGSFAKSFVVHVGNLNDPPSSITLKTSSVRENMPVGTLIDTLKVTDEDSGDHIVLSLPTGIQDNDYCAISGNLLKTARVIDYESDHSYNITVKCTDDSSASILQSFTITVIDVDEIAPAISPAEFSETYVSGSGSKSFRIDATDNTGISTVFFYHKGISGKTWTRESVPLSGAPHFTYSYNESMLDEMGMDFRFTVMDAAGNKDSVFSTVYMEYETSQSPSIPGLKFGGRLDTYQIIAIPYNLNDNKVSAVFNGLGTYDKKVWRLLTYNNNANNYLEYNQFSGIEVGVGYWFNAVSQVEISVGAGTALFNTQENPYSKTLKQGWNQIGNPYPFAISWSDVKSANTGTVNFGDPKSSDDGVTFKNLSVIPAFRGAFVKADGNMTLVIPPLKAGTIGRTTGGFFTDDPLDHEQWNVNLAFDVHGYRYDLGGFGMHPDAFNGEDPYDDYTAPHLFNYLEINFQTTPDQRYRVTRDIVPTSENHYWEFSAETNLGGKAILSWDNRYFGDNDRQLMLYDVVNQSIIDMRKVTEYIFDPVKGNRFRVYYGNDDFIEKELFPDRNKLGLPYPNPFDEQIIIPFAVSKDFGNAFSELSIYNVGGEKVATLVSRPLASGFYQIIWEGQGFTGERLKPGLYICKLTVAFNHKNSNYSRKIILK